jgi:glutaconate CoA-transferase, subunit B
VTIPNATAEELMTVVASRALRNDDVCFVGIGAPSAACNLARAIHAPDLVLIYESGTIETRPEVLPLSIGDGELCDTALVTVSVPELFSYWLQAGRISKGFLGGAQIDRFANINSTVIGDYHEPTVRLPGAGGAPEIAADCGEVFIIARHQPRVLVERIDFLTSFGHGTGGTARVDAGLSTQGPTLLVTDLCMMRPEDGSRELVVTSIHPGVTRDQIRARTGWAVRFAPDAERTPPPTADELSVLRDLQERTRRAHTGD